MQTFVVDETARTSIVRLEAVPGGGDGYLPDDTTVTIVTDQDHEIVVQICGAKVEVRAIQPATPIQQLSLEHGTYLVRDHLEVGSTIVARLDGLKSHPAQSTFMVLGVVTALDAHVSRL